MKTYRLKCGCVVESGERERYVELCPPHKAETDELRARAAADYRATHQDSEFKEAT